MSRPVAIIWGIGGQDGAYLARLLLEKGYRVHGTSRATGVPVNLRRLGIAEDIALHAVDPTDAPRVGEAIAAAAPDEIYYLASQSSVGRSFAEPEATFAGAALGLLNVLEAARHKAPAAALLNAASGDCFGETATAATETTRFAPRSPYAAAKCSAHLLIEANRVAYGQRVCSAFLFPHESPLRPDSFVIGKLMAAIRRFAAGDRAPLELGDLGVVRDWGWAPDFVAAMWAMLQRGTPEDLILATGTSMRLEDFVAAAFAAIGLNWRDHVQCVAGLHRPADIAQQRANPSRAAKLIGWRPSVAGEELPKLLVAQALSQAA
ncbi:GDP-mannose 4,6-dehydratase [Sphingomonas pruni]|uniref:GDP-mannose 4,6-dehydratase n=1 Tax=Sphingomonas pruni TaxID=40683 RepID=UPI00082BD144|nr:GDP-mannose 4,6-dehydratase [Sphingomonas pruni]